MLVHFIDCDELRINSENNCPEYNQKNNYSKTKGILRKSKPLKIQLLPGVDDLQKAQICTTPVLGYNRYNGLMPGIAIYNDPIPQKKFSYFMMPMYGISDKSLAGYARTGFTLLPECSKLQMIWLGASASQFSYSNDPFALKFTKLAPEILIKLKNKDPRSTLVKEIRFRNININKEVVEYSQLSDSGHYEPSKVNLSYYVNQVSFSLDEKRKINPYSFSFVAEQGDKFLKTSVEGNYKLSYNRQNKFLSIRAFFGGFVYQKASEINGQLDFRYHLNGTSGDNDYLFDHYFVGRTAGSGLWSKQFCENDGGFKTITYLGQTWKWLGAINLKTTIPGRLPLKLFADIGTYEGAGTAGSNTIAYEVGINLSIINNTFEIYFPVFLSADLKKNIDQIGISRWENIHFTFNLEKADPFKLLRDIR